MNGVGEAYVVGLADWIPIRYAPQPGSGGGDDAFVTKLNADGSALVYSTYLGGSGNEYPVILELDTARFGIAVDGSGNAYVAGRTDSTDFPVVNALYDTNRGGGYDAFVTKLQWHPDFFFSPVSPITADVGGSGSSTVRVNSFDDFNALVDLSATGQPGGMTASFDKASVTPPVGSSTTSTLTLTLGPSVTPRSYTLTVTGTSGSLTHSVPINVTVNATPEAVTEVIDTFGALGCIDNGGIVNAFTVKLAQAQAAISAGDIQTAINILTALLHELQAQAGKHIKSCTDSNGNTIDDPAAALIADVQALLASLGANLKPNPVMGSILNSSNSGIYGATVTVLNSAKTVVASATTDTTGFYFFAKTSVFVTGSKYTVKVSPPKPYKSSTPVSQTFSWNATAVTLGNFVLN